MRMSEGIQAQVFESCWLCYNGLCVCRSFITKPLFAFLANQTLPSSSSFHKERRRTGTSREYDYREVRNQD